MKKIFINILLIILSLSFIQCGGAKKPEKEPGKKTIINLGDYPDITRVALNANRSSASSRKLIKTLRTDVSSKRRAYAALMIGKVKHLPANKDLLFSLRNDDDIVRARVLLALGKLRVSTNFRPIYSIWKNRSESFKIRKIALRSIGYFNKPLAVNTLFKLIKKNSSTYADIAIQAIANSRSPIAARKLMSLLIKTQSYRKGDIVDALVKLKQRVVYDRIIKYLDDKVYRNKWDTEFLKLIELLLNEKYNPAVTLFIKTYLLNPHITQELQKRILKTLKKMGLRRSYVIVSEGAMNLRSRPNLRAKVKGVLDVGKLGIVLEKTRIKYNIGGLEDFWYKVKTLEGKIGWLFGGYIKKFDHAKL